ncbi:putative ABC transport system permease protein [Pontibacter ummariensis]|uniref:Putative ABC transport system permease protein n=1 Tax=Pontibacter ummariensis TaxID=1610492 RepID=A0A239BTR0_9BACT|nr:putative ABC transport system permease protein [Pontibacter ummariensis]SNS10808.1 putative ABC transport system permease protein [Pontibacter ummariensis]
MAWRDSRRNRGRLALFISSIVLGIAALVAINSFADNLRTDIDRQAKSLIGADLVIASNRVLEPDMQHLVDSIAIGGERSDEIRFVSMVFFQASQGTRLVQVRALEDAGFPYYGTIETEPVEASRAFRHGGRKALVDETLLLQFNTKPGDSIKVGNLTFEIAGALKKIPGQTAVTATIAPAVYIPKRYAEETGLLQKGSRISYYFYYNLPVTTDADALVKKLEPRLEEAGFGYDTVKSRKESTGEAYDNLARFLALVGFVALLLGCVGVASAVHVYIREKLATIGVLRCLGVSGKQAFLIYLFQIMAMGFIGSVVGAVLGSLIQLYLPQLFQAFLPVEVTLSVSWSAIAVGIGIGVVVAVLFALLPLLTIRNVSPLITLRAGIEHLTSQRDTLRWGVYALILGFIFLFAYLQLGTWLRALSFTGGVLASFLVLALLARLMMWLVKRFFPVNWGYVWRQSLANLYRPNNQTLLLTVSIGLGTALIATLFLMQRLLLSEVAFAGSENQPNLVLFDIQNAQKEEVAAFAEAQGLPVLQYVPVVTMRLEEINGLTAADVRSDTTLGIPDWAFTREYRVTYRDTLIASETGVGGTWGGMAGPADSPIPISVEDRYAERLKAELGDTLIFNVQGALVPTVVAHLREVEWNRVQSNFRVLFPKGVLEEAPQFHVLMTRTQTDAQSAQFQRELVQLFPNVSAIDLGLILQTLDDILGKISFVIRFMALFSITTGLLVLIGSINISKFQRVQESVLLRTLGANKKQILSINAFEYLLLGMLAAGTGVLISIGASWALAVYSFEVEFVPDLAPLLPVFLGITALTVLIGMLNSRGVLSRPPLEVLRREAA